MIDTIWENKIKGPTKPWWKIHTYAGNIIIIDDSRLHSDIERFTGAIDHEGDSYTFTSHCKRFTANATIYEGDII
jgi:hypothetical protein